MDKEQLVRMFRRPAAFGVAIVAIVMAIVVWPNPEVKSPVTIGLPACAWRIELFLAGQYEFAKSQSSTDAWWFARNDKEYDARHVLEGIDGLVRQAGELMAPGTTFTIAGKEDCVVERDYQRKEIITFAAELKISISAHEGRTVSLTVTTGSNRADFELTATYASHAPVWRLDMGRSWPGQ